MWDIEMFIAINISLKIEGISSSITHYESLSTSKVETEILNDASVQLNL